MTTNSKEVDDALRALETKHRTEDFLRKIGASDEAAALLASHPDQVKRFTWDGVNLHFGKSDLAAVDDPAAKSHFLEGPFAALFAKPVEPATDGDQQVDPVVLASARAGIPLKGRAAEYNIPETSSLPGLTRQSMRPSRMRQATGKPSAATIQHGRAGQPRA